MSIISNKDKKIILALINSDNRKRYKKIKPNLDKLKQKLDKKYSVEIYVVTNQPQKVVKNTLFTVFSRMLYLKYSREYVAYREKKNRSVIMEILSIIHRIIITLVNREYEDWRCGIVTYVADKHIKSWNKLIDANADLIICFENDAIFNKDSISKLGDVVDKSMKISKSLYVDLAGGCDPKTLQVEKLEYKSDDLYKYYKKPVTNTVCCYMMNRRLVQEVYLGLMFWPWTRLLSADWILNKIFVEMDKVNKKTYCFHAFPHILEHGSVTGVFGSLE